MTDHQPPSSLTIGEARDWLRPRTENPGGVTCPVCGQHAQAYKRSVTLPMVRVLRRMLAKAVRDKQDYAAWVKLADIEQETRDAGMLAYWGLIEEHELKRGWWRVTENGEAFLRNDLVIEKYAHVYRNKVYAHTGAPVRLSDVDPKFKLRSVKDEADNPEPESSQTRLLDDEEES